jgi:hypothetical protein
MGQLCSYVSNCFLVLRMSFMKNIDGKFINVCHACFLYKVCEYEIRLDHEFYDV